MLQVEVGVTHRPSAKGIRLIINSTRMIVRYSSLYLYSVGAKVGDITARGIDGDDQPVIVETTSKSKGTIVLFKSHPHILMCSPTCE